MHQETHIAGIVVFASPESISTLRTAVSLIPRAQVHAAAADGRIVVTLETESTKRTLDQMDAIRALPGVINVALVYQHAEQTAAMDEEV